MNVREVIARMNPYELWKPLRKYPPNLHSQITTHSAGVFELPNDVVKKVYNPTDAAHIKRFQHERKILEYLTKMGSKHTPSLLFVDEKNATLFMTNCGSTNPSDAKSDAKSKADIHRVMRELESKFGLRYTPNAGRKTYRYHPHGIAWRNGRIFILDFHDASSWTLNPPPPDPNAPIQDSNVEKKVGI